MDATNLFISDWLPTGLASLVELLYAAERMPELNNNPEIMDPNVRPVVTSTPAEGVGSVEAPRGTLTHHYWSDENGILTKVNMIVGTTNNNAPIAIYVGEEGSQDINHQGHCCFQWPLE